MSSAAMHFASGNSLFSGLLLLVAAYAVLLPRADRLRKVAARISPLLLISGVLFVALSSTPIPPVLAGCALICLIPLVLEVLRPRPPGTNTGRKWLSGGLMGVVLAAAPVLVVEILSLMGPNPGEFGARLPVHVIGDSISAANTDGSITAWPELLADRGSAVENHARVAATAGSALKQAQRIPAGPAQVHLLIGGNDIFGAGDAARFEADLDDLLSAAGGPGRIVVLWELPLPPFHHRFSAAQRRQVRKHRALMISKRVLSRVFATPGATVDGIHLSQSGQRLLADMVVAMQQQAR